MISIVRGFLYISVISFALSGIMGTDGVWISFVIAEMLTLITVTIVIRLRTGRFPRTVDDYLMLDDMGSGEILNISLPNDLDEIMRRTTEIEGHCISEGVDADSAHRVALCIEELAGNIARHAFPDGGVHYISIRITRSGDDILFRLRDDGRYFNPVEGKHDGFGIKIAKAVAKDIEYSYTMGMNNLTVVL